ncbi:MAG: orotate phosphoribosyltransferase [Gammaproteobacteria bacterium]|nr:orotate phosphoribosyltransferase [Gammaproteobacteria bacterium]
MPHTQKEFIEFALAHQVLQFGKFTLKSGRKSPFFFNTGLFNTGSTLAKLGTFYATALEESQIPYDLLFGSAYKGIPLAAATAIALAEHFGKSIPYSFNRKEAKTHGEGGVMVGAPLKGRLIIIDDVISAGTTTREVLPLIKASGAKPVGILIALDRQEKGLESPMSAADEIKQSYQIPVIAIIKLEHILEHLKQQPTQQAVYREIQAYQTQYGSTS